jgi:type III pantothenate kinase
LYPGEALLIVTCGTATTIDAISADGVFTGGMILPGLRLMAAALHRHTAQLPAVAERMHASDAFADNTEDAIVLGCLSAQAGAIERARSRLPQARCIISGGAGRMVAPFLDGPSTWVDNLVLLGLHAAAIEKESGC